MISSGKYLQHKNMPNVIKKNMMSTIMEASYLNFLTWICSFMCSCSSVVFRPTSFSSSTCVPSFRNFPRRDNTKLLRRKKTMHRHSKSFIQDAIVVVVDVVVVVVAVVIVVVIIIVLLLLLNCCCYCC